MNEQDGNAARMRILYITVSMPFGPSEAFFIPEVRELIRLGHQVLIVQRSPEGNVTNHDADGLQDISVRQRLLSFGIVGAAMLESLLHPFASLRALALLFKSRGLFTLLKNFMVFPKGLWLGRLARQWGADHIHVQWALTTATMGMVASEITGIPWSCTAHRVDIVLDNLLAVKIDHAAFFRFISKSGVALAQSHGVAGRDHKVHVIHMGVLLPPAGQIDSPIQNVARLLCPANLFPVKGHQYLFRAMALLKQRGVECQLDVAGEGHLEGQLHALARELSIDDRIRFLGQVPHERLLAVLRERQAALVVLPSVDLGEGLHEGIPVALIEAMSLGVPVLSTSTGGIPELLCDGAGIMVPPEDPLALADAIEQVLSDPELRKRLAKAGRQRVEEEFSVKAAVDKLIEHIQNSEQ